MATVVYKDEYTLENEGVDNGEGTPEVSEESYSKPGDPIKNVSDVHSALKYLIKNEPYFALENELIFQGKTKIGEIHVWVDSDRKMEYRPTE